MYDHNAERAKRHAERKKEFGDRPFTFGSRIVLAEDGETSENVPETFYIRANSGYLAIKHVAGLTEASTGVETFEAIEESVFSMIDPRDNALERFQAVVRNNDDPVTFDDLIVLQGWLMQEQTGRPPTPEPPSAPTPTATGPSSTVLSSTEPAGASTT